jgi:CYTH domain-containing protein
MFGRKTMYNELEHETGKEPPMEIERKYLIHTLPEDIESYPRHRIAQGYLCTSPVVRIRRSDDEYYLTYKGGGLMVREEYNLPLTKEAYEHLLPKVDGLLISKTRYLIPLTAGTGIDHPLTAELDVFEADLAPLMLVEVEFESVDEANAFTAPDWFGEDVTEDGRYHNSYMSRYGLTR